MSNKHKTAHFEFGELNVGHKVPPVELVERQTQWPLFRMSTDAKAKNADNEKAWFREKPLRVTEGNTY